jgi:hypothetical protein
MLYIFIQFSVHTSVKVLRIFPFVSSCKKHDVSFKHNDAKKSTSRVIVVSANAECVSSLLLCCRSDAENSDEGNGCERPHTLPLEKPPPGLPNFFPFSCIFSLTLTTLSHQISTEGEQH